MNRTLLIVLAASLAACSPKGERLLQRAEASLDKGEYRAAMIDLQNYLSDHPDDSRARAQLGLALLELGDVQGAEAEVRKARELGAAAADLLVPECRLMASRNAYERILAECSAGTGDPVRDAELLVVRGGALLGLARNDEAVDAFRAAVAAAPDLLTAYQGLAVALQVTRGAEAARDAMGSAPSALKEQPRFWTALGGVEMRGQQLEVAAQAFGKAVELSEGGDLDSPDRLVALAGLTEVQLRMGETQAAGLTSEKLLKAAPRAPLARILRAQAVAGAGDLAQARTLLEEVVSQSPEDVEARVLLGMVNFQLGNLGQAEMHLANAVARQPDNVRAQRLLTEVRSRVMTPEEALEALKRSMVKAGNDPALLALASQLSLQRGDREAALAYLNQASTAEGGRTPAGLLELAGGYLMAGEVERAVALLEQLPEESGDAGLRRESLLLTALLQQGKGAEATARAEALVKRSPESSASRILAGALYAALGRNELAREQFEEAARLAPGDVVPQVRLAQLDLAAGKPDDAAGRFQRVLDRDAKNLVASLGMSAVAMARRDVKDAERWLLKARADHPQSIDARLSLVQHYLARRDFGQAREAAREATRLAPDSAAVANGLGLAELGMGDSGAALGSFAKAARLEPAAYGYSLNMARAHMQRREAAAALDTVDAVLKSAPGLVPALGLGATIALQSGDVERAAGYIERLRLAAPGSPIQSRLDGDLAMAQKRYSDAVNEYARAADVAPDTALVMAQYRAATLAGRPSPHKVVEVWLAQHPQDVVARIALAEHYASGGERTRAIAAYEEGLKQGPNNPVLLNNLAYLYYRQGDPRALETAERAYAAAPNVAAIQDTYGWLLVEAGKLDDGLQLLRKSAQGLQDSPEAQYHFGVALARRGETAEARRVLEKVVAGSGPEDIKAEARRAMGALAE